MCVNLKVLPLSTQTTWPTRSFFIFMDVAHPPLYNSSPWWSLFNMLPFEAWRCTLLIPAASMKFRHMNHFFSCVKIIFKGERERETERIEFRVKLAVFTLTPFFWGNNETSPLHFYYIFFIPFSLLLQSSWQPKHTL